MRRLSRQGFLGRPIKNARRIKLIVLACLLLIKAFLAEFSSGWWRGCNKAANWIVQRRSGSDCFCFPDSIPTLEWSRSTSRMSCRGSMQIAAMITFKSMNSPSDAADDDGAEMKIAARWRRYERWLLRLVILVFPNYSVFLCTLAMMCLMHSGALQILDCEKFKMIASWLCLLMHSANGYFVHNNCFQ